MWGWSMRLAADLQASASGLRERAGILLDRADLIARIISATAPMAFASGWGTSGICR
jgi:hypothetical protein